MQRFCVLQRFSICVKGVAVLEGRCYRPAPRTNCAELCDNHEILHSQVCMVYSRKKKVFFSLLSSACSSFLHSLTARYTHLAWQKEWDKAVLVSDKIHEISPKHSDKLLFCKTGKEETVLNRLHIGHSYLTHSFTLKKKKSFLFGLHVMLLSQTNIS